MKLSTTLLGTALLGLVGALGVGPATHADQSAGSLESVVVDRLAVEQVYQLHRTGARVDRRVPARAVRTTVEDALRLTTALERVWGVRVPVGRLEAELERMARHTRAPERLAELFAAVGHDGGRAAEAIARPVLVERLARRLYAMDGARHRRVNERARAGLARLVVGDSPEELLRDDALARQLTVTIVRDDGDDGGPLNGNAGQPPVLRPTAGDWDRLVARLGRLLEVPETRLRGAAPDLPVGRWTPLQEDERRFWTSSVVRSGEDRLRLRRVVWAKRPFDAWWNEVRDRFAPAPPLALESGAALPQPGVGAADSAPEGFVDAPAGSWEALFRSPAPRREHTAVWTGSEMIVWGGLSGGTAARDDGGRYDPATDTWQPLSAAGAPGPRYAHTAVWTGSEMVVWGGRDGAGAPLADGARYDPSADAWQSVTSSGAPGERFDHTAVWTGSRMIVWGGREGVDGPLATGGTYDPAADSWTATAEEGAPAARHDHVAAWTGSEMVVWGGAGTDVLLSDGAAYDVSGDAWTPLSETGSPSARRSHTAVWSGERVLIWGGRDTNGASLDDGASYDPVADGWSDLAASGAPQGRFDHTAVWTGTQMVVWGGRGAGGVLDDGGEYTPASDAWSPTGTGELVPPARSQHTAVWTDAEMIVWGGGPGVGGVLNSGGRYDPAGDDWTPTFVNRPQADHSAVWTGSEMIVWGGTDGTAFRAEGERYDPATDTWTAVGVDDATPAARGLHRAVWTGSEMIVWGGYGDEGTLDTGARYDPAADAWEEMTVESVPQQRFDHTAVWTGSEMIVWGGRDQVSLSSGGRYDPAADTWQEIGGVVQGRHRHTAVWTGSEMIVWGGYGIAGNLNDGARYDVEDDEWSVMTTSGAPAARRGHVAAWSGTEMLVWGGYVGRDRFPETGGRYNPTTDVWRELPAATDTPEGRQIAASVWTGRELVFWGGERADPIRTGGRYNPFDELWVPMEPAPVGLEARVGHTAVWSSEGLIVWGGESGSPLNDGAIYTVVYTWFRDEDGDGFGTPAETTEAIVRPDGFSGSPDDCDDTNAAVFPGAREINDGLDNDCPGEPGFGLIDENSGESGFRDPEDKTLYSWDPQEGATEYEAARASDPLFDTGCDGTVTTDTSWVDPDEPQPGEAFYYLNRPTAPNVGSWGETSAGVERSGACL
jgi:N-acetylneuraminic acid mutarotase